MDANMEELEKNMGIKIERVRDMMLDRFCGVDQKLVAIEELLRKMMEVQNQNGTTIPEKMCNLSGKNIRGGTEGSKSKDKGKNVQEKTDLVGGLKKKKEGKSKASMAPEGGVSAAGVDQNSMAFEDFPSKTMEVQNQVGTALEKRRNLTEKNTGGAEGSKYQDKGTNMQEKNQIFGTDGSSENGQDVAEQTLDQGGGCKEKESWCPKRDRLGTQVGGPNDGLISESGPFTTEVELNQNYGNGGGLEEADRDCLGGEVDTFDMDDNLIETGSPGTDLGLAKPVFGDGLDLNGMNVEQTTWGMGLAPEDGTSSGGWGGVVKTTPATGGGWGEAKSDRAQQTEFWGGWGAGSCGGWGSRKGLDIEPSKSGTSSGGWGGAVKTTPATSSGWGEAKSDRAQQTGSWGGWGAPKDIEPYGSCGGWGSRKGRDIEPSKNGTSSGGWGGAVKTTGATGCGWGEAKSDRAQQTVSCGDWGAPKFQDTEPSGSCGGWGSRKGQDIEPSGSWGGLDLDGMNVEHSTWGRGPVSKDGTSSGGWGGAKSDRAQQTGSWGGWGAPKDIEPYGSWGSGSSSWCQKVVKEDGLEWGGNKSGNNTEKGSGSGWDKKVVSADGPGDGSGWNSKPSEPPVDQAETPQDSSMGGKAIQNETNCKWVSDESDQGLGWNAAWAKKVGKKPQAQVVHKGSLEKGNEESEKTGLSGWNEEGQGSKRKHPDSSAGGPNDDPISSGQLNTSKRRLYMFTDDEQEILNEIETMKQSIQRIMHQKGYNDGEPLSAVDQTYILENVFNHHPEKAQKMGTGLDYVMISKHMEFEQSRCFYIVATDGGKEDFCYHKCVWNFISEKYPDKLQDFISKYFKISEPWESWDPRNMDFGGSGLVEFRTSSSWSGLDPETRVVADEAGPSSGW